MTRPAPTARVRDRGRAAYGRRDWVEAFDLLGSADRAAPLEPADLQLLADAAYLTGRDETGDDLTARAFGAWERRDEPARAARCAFWLGIHLQLRGEVARGGGWLARG